MSESIGKTISKDSIGNYSQKLVDNAKQSVTDTLKTTSKTAEVNGTVTSNKTANRIMMASQNFQQNNSETRYYKLYY